MKHQLGWKCLISALLALPLSLTLCGIYGWAGPGTLLDAYMVVIWLIVPVWTLIFCISITMKSLLKLTVLLCVMNLIAFAALLFFRVNH